MPGPIIEKGPNAAYTLRREETKYKLILLAFVSISIFIAGIYIGYSKRADIASHLKQHTSTRAHEGRELSNALMMQARAAMNAKDLDKAISLYNQALTNGSDIVRAHLDLGLLHDQHKKNYIRAIYHYERYLELRPQSEKRPMIEDLIRSARTLCSEEFACAPSSNTDRQRSLLMKKNRNHLLNSQPIPLELPMEVHIVNENETLPEISLKYFGHTKGWERICKANGDHIHNPQRLTPGSYIIIPKSSICDSPNLHLDVDGCPLPMIWIPSIGLWSATHEVPNELYSKFKSTTPALDNALPVTYVSWHDATSFCNWLSEKYKTRIPKGYAFRLPTEEEWTELCSTGGTSIYPWGNAWPPPPEWNYMGSENKDAQKKIVGHTDEFKQCAPVTACGTNTWGLVGMGGNVWEWCSDWYDSEQQKRVVRGASWHNYSRSTLKSSFRSPKALEARDNVTGFRVVLGVAQ